MVRWQVRRHARALVVSCGLGVGLGCGPSEEPAKAPAAPAGQPAKTAEAPEPDLSWAVDEAEDIFATRCFTCHGKEGRGDGPGSASLDPKPRNFQDPAWQAEVSDEDLSRIILYGGAAVGRSPTMPGNPDLMSRQEVVVALIEHVRDLGAQ